MVFVYSHQTERMVSEIKESEPPPSQSQRADPLQSQSAAKSNKLYIFFWHAYSSVMYSLYEIEVPKPLPPSPDEATQADEIKNPKKLLPVLQLKTGQYPDGMSCVSLGSKLYFVGGEFNMDNPYIDEDVKKNFKDSERDVFPRQLLILDLSDVGASGDELHKLLVNGEQMRCGKARPHAFVAEEKIYVIGSTIESSISHRSKLTRLNLESFIYFEVYDPEVGQWHDLPDPPIGNVKTRWVGHAIVGRKALLVAWQGGKERLYCFDLGESCWEKETHASIPFYPENFSGRTEFVEDTLYGCYHNTIAAIAPVEGKKIEKEEKKEKKRKREKIEGKKVKAGEKMEAEKVKAKETVEAEEEEEDAKDFGQGWLLENLHLHVLSEEMGMDAIFNVPPQLRSSSSLLHLGNRDFCYVKSGMPPNSDDDSDDDIKDDKKRFISIVIFQALGKKYEKDGTGLLQAQFLYSVHYEINSHFPNEGFINGCFFPGSVPSHLEQLASIAVGEAEQEIKLVVDVDQEVRKLEDNLRMIQAVLEDAEKRQMTEAAVKLWLGKLKDTFYLMDDVLDEWNTELIKLRIQEEEKEEEIAESSHARKKMKVSLSMIPSPSSYLRQVHKLSMRDDFAHKIKDLTGKLDELFKERDGFEFELNRGTKVVERPTTTSLVDVSKICGRRKEREELVSILLGQDSQEEKSPPVISLIGMGGIGKTTLAQLAYNDYEVQTNFETRIWVCVFDPFDQIRVAKAIVESIVGQSPNITELQNLLKTIRDLIGGKRFFLVLDDVWSEEPNDWEPFELALKCGAQGSRILITTRKEGVAKMVNSAYTINLEVLSDEDNWLICSQMASVHKDDEQLGKLGRELANKCKGLPLAAKILGSVMGSQRSMQKWKTILYSNLWELEDVQNGVLGPLLFSYNELPLAIKQCFLYCANFPKDYLFFRNELVYQWMAQGYLGSKSNMEDMGERYFEKLVMHSFFQDFERDQNDDDKIISCKMHDMVHDFVLSMTTNECFTVDVDKVLGIDWKSARHLTLELNEETQLPVSIYNAKNLRTLFLRTPHFGRMVFSSDLFQHLTCLRSLNLKYGSFEKLPNEVEKLKHLRLLNLSNNTQITELPEMMCNLCNLQTLNISYCSLKKLPQRMGKLIKLRHLLINCCNELTEPFPKGIGSLSSLRTLEKFITGGINNTGECKLGELKNLVHLKGSLEIKGLENVTDVQEAENAELKNKIHLRKLRLWFGGQAENRRGENDELVLNALEPHPELESLWIYGYGGTGYPNWVMSLTILKKLELQSWDNLEQLPPLGKLRFLESLEICDLDSVKKVGVEFLGIESNRKKDEEKGSTSTSSLSLFPHLKSLCFRKMEKWEEWDGMGESGVSESVLIMPRLQLLTIEECPKLKSLPNFLEKTLLEKLSVDCRISNWMTLACNLPRLKSLTCSNLNNGEHFSTLGKLLFLESLNIFGAESVKKVGFEFLGIEEESKNNKKKKIDEEKGSTSSSLSSLVLFPNLKSLIFWSLEEWEEWDGIGGTMREEEAQESGVTITIMPRLQKLLICFCPKLKSLPDFLPTTPLKNLDIFDSPILSKCCKAEIGDQWPKISHIPNIRINGTYVRRDGSPMQT